MKPWLNLKDIFSFQPPAHDDSPSLLSEIYREFHFQADGSIDKNQIQNIRFDNSMRIVISLMALATAFFLWIGKLIPSIGPIILIFSTYSALQILGGWSLARFRHYREINYAICTVDIVALSLGVYWTGHFNSPLYFIYFMPLIIQAFHRDWALLVYYGLGGVVLYTMVVVASVTEWSSQSLVSLGSRVLFMAFTVGLALLAVNLLRKNELLEKRRMSRLKCLVYISQILNGIGTLKDLEPAVEGFIKVMNLELREPNQSVSRIFLIQNSEPLMQALQDPANPLTELKQSLPHAGCPAIQGNRNFEIKDRDNEAGCPVESFSMFRSHLCVPIVGEANEPFGVIFSGSPTPKAFHEEDTQFLQFIGKSLGLAFQRLKRVEELNQVFEMDSAAMATFLSSTRTVEDTGSAIMDGIRAILNADQVQLFLWNSEKAKLVTNSVVGLFDKQTRNNSYALGEGIPGRVLEKGEPYWTYNLQGESFYDPSANFRGLLAVPLQTMKGEPLGVVIASILSGQRTFSVEEIDLASTFCTRASVAIENANLHFKERQSMEEAA